MFGEASIAKQIFGVDDTYRKRYNCRSQPRKGAALGRIVQYFDRKRGTSSVWNDYELKMRGCEQYGIARRNGFLYLDSCQKIQFRVPGDLSRSMEQISAEELAAGMLTILKQEGVTDKKDLYRTLALQCGVHRLGKEISRILDNALCLIEDSVVISGDELALK